MPCDSLECSPAGEGNNLHDEFEPEVFPLPPYNTYMPNSSFCNRSHSKCLRVSWGRVEVANEIVFGLNWCANSTKQFSGSVTSGSVSRAQRRALKHIWQLAREARPPSDVPTPLGAARELLKLDSTYSGDSGAHLARFGEGEISLPSGDRSPVDLAGVLEGFPKHSLDNFQEHLLRADNDWGADCEHVNSIKPYCDPALYLEKNYFEFLDLLWKAKILDFTCKPLGHVEAFFVKKKNGKLRLVLDCRQVNRSFREPPHISMGTLAALSEIMLEDGDTLYISQADVKDCFWQCKLPHALARFFALRKVPGSWLLARGIDTVEGMPISSGDRVSPVVCCLPMGWPGPCGMSKFYTNKLFKTQVQWIPIG